MVSVSSNYNLPISGSSLQAAGTKSPVSIFNEKGGQSATASAAGNTSLPQKLQQEIEALLKNYEGVTFADLQRIQSKLGLKFDSKDMTDEKIQKMVQLLKQQLDAAVVDGKVDLNKLENGIKDVAEQYRFITKGLVAMLIQKGFLSQEDVKNAKKASDIAPEKLKAAVEKFITSFVAKIQTEGLNVKDKAAALRQIAAGTSTEDRDLIFNIVIDVLSTNEDIQKAISEFIISCTTPEQIKDFISKLSSQFSQEDLKKLGINTDILAMATAEAVIKDPEKFEELVNAVLGQIKELREKYGPMFEKIEQYKSEHQGEELTDEVLMQELGLSQEDIENYRILSRLSGMFLGLNIGGQKVGKQISDDWKNQLPDLFGQYGYQNFLDSVRDFFDKHANELDISKEDFTKYFDDATKGKFSGNTEPYEAAENASAQNNESGVGYNNPTLTSEQPQQVDPLDLAAKFYQTYAEPEEGKITVEAAEESPKSPEKASDAISLSGITADKIKDAIKRKVFKSTTEAVCVALKKYKDLSGSAKQWVTDTLGAMSDTYQKYIIRKGLPGSVMVALALLGLLDSKDLANTGATKEQKEKVERLTAKKQAA